MANVQKLMENLQKQGYVVSYYETAAEAAKVLKDSIKGKTIGFGGSCTLRDMGLYELLSEENQVFWHWKQQPVNEARAKANAAEIYMTSLNGVAETGELINIDGDGNRLAATTFGPDASCTRGQVVTFLWRAAGCPEPKSSETPFKDLKKGAFYEKAVAWAVEEGITKGMSDTKFDPDGKCNRGQIVTFLWRFKGSEEPASTATPFKDLKKGAFYEKAVAWAVEKNVTKGMTDTTFAPDGVCTRGQVVTFLYRATQG